MVLNPLFYQIAAMVIGTSSGLACQPTHSDLQQYFQWAGGKGHESHLHLLSPVFVQNGTAFRNFNGNQLDFLRDQILLGQTVCEDTPRPAQSDLHDRSLCSWYWRMDFDPRRIPAAIPTAKCACEMQKIAGVQFECHLMKYRFRVLRYVGDPDQCEQLKPDEMEIGVACVAAPVARQQGLPPSEKDLLEPNF